MAPLYNCVSGKAFISGPVRTTLEKFESGVFKLRRRNLKTVAGHFGFVLEEN